MRQSDKFGSVMNDDIFNSHLGFGAGHLSIELDNSTTMELFCQEPLTITKDCQTTFKPDYYKLKRQPRRYKIVSFFNVPVKIHVQHLTDFLDQYANVEDQPRHQIKVCKDIEYRMGTITYKVTYIITHIPRHNHLFGRTVKCVCTGQPTPNKNNQHQQQTVKMR